MSLNKMLGFLMQAVTVGLAAALVLFFLQPRSTPPGPTVEISQAPPPAPEPSSAATRSGPVSYADAVDRAAPAVVNIHIAKVVAGSRFHDPLTQRLLGEAGGKRPPHVETSLGSGVIVSPQGYILTNHHVVATADAIRVLLEDGRTAPATIVGSDPESDLSVLKIDLGDLPSVTLAPAGRLRVGDVVLAIGNPYGVGQAVSMGIVSAKGRNHLGINTFENFIQTDAAINPGNSGGALVNALGELVGINTAIFSKTGGSQGIGFAIPISLAQGVMQSIIERGRVVRGWLGIEVQEGRLATGERRVVVVGVLDGGPAERGGLRPGDIVTEVNDQPVSDARGMLDLIAALAPGTVARVRVYRGGEEKLLRVTVSQRPAAG